MQELTADFAPKYYDSHPGDTDKPILFLIHGTMGSTASHYGFMFPILAHRYRVVSIDFQDTDTEQLELQQLVEQSVTAIKGACPGAESSRSRILARCGRCSRSGRSAPRIGRSTRVGLRLGKDRPAAATP